MTMYKSKNSRGMLALLAACCMFPVAALGATAQVPGGLTASMDEKTGAYELLAADPAWSFKGTLNAATTGLTTKAGKDRIGDYQELAFDWQADGKPLAGSIRVYAGRPVALFTITNPQAMAKPAPAFPAFTALPANLKIFSYKQAVFSPPVYGPTQGSTPWLLFDDAGDACVVSPAAHFMAARMTGDGKALVACGLNPEIKVIPAGFQQQSLVTVGRGITHTWDAWGHALTDLQGKTRIANDADTGLKYFGYWTDNGAFYYYNYDLTRGYANTLLDVLAHYREQQIPQRYLQLDSWWYYKTLTGSDGKTGKPKNAKLPEGEWNRYGGLLEYTAHKFLFPDGLEAFQQKAGMPLITHNRWVDPASPYHDKYKISGLAAVDPKFWDEIATYLKANGVTTYEQDWLSDIFAHSPELSGTVDMGDAFLDNMARATKERGITMQYCMAYPCYFLQGSKYGNLTTIRVSDDNFIRARWRSFMFTSQLAASVGSWPWTDVFATADHSAVLLADLSGGMVGNGDAIGKEDRAAIMRAVRADGVIVKPDVPLVPTDETWIAQAGTNADVMVASTYSDHAAGRTAYVFAFNQKRGERGTVAFKPASLGVTGDAYVIDGVTGKAARVEPGAAFSETLAADGTGFYVVVPVGRGGLAFAGDAAKYVALGRQRIAEVRDDAGKTEADVVFAEMEKTVTLHGYAGSAPKASATGANVSAVTFDVATGHFTVEISPTGELDKTGADPVRRATVTLRP